jgi:cytochrome c oxidase subunit 2
VRIDLYEKIWMWGVGAMLTLFFAATAVSAVTRSAHPPSHVETIDPAQVMRDPRFRTQGVSVDAAGRVHVHVVGLAFAWLPRELTLPADTPITFHLTALDVVHGYQIVQTNAQAMTIPGYVSRYTATFPTPGEHLVVCNEFCGTGHHTMYGTLTVVPKERWTAPAVRTPAAHDRHPGGPGAR